MTPVRDEVKKNVLTEARCIYPLISNAPYFDVHQGLSNLVKNVAWSTVNLRVWGKVYDTHL